MGWRDGWRNGWRRWRVDKLRPAHQTLTSVLPPLTSQQALYCHGKTLHLLLTSSSPPVFVPHVLFSQFKTLYFIFFSPPFPPLNVFSAPPHHLLFLLLITSFYFLSSLLLLHMYLWKNWQNFPFIYLHHPPLSSLTPSSPPLHLLFSCCCVFLPLLHVAPAEQIQTHHTRLHCIFGCFNSVGLSV